jgi:hypothetical protein
MSSLMRVYEALIACAFPNSESRAMDVSMLIEPVPASGGWVGHGGGECPVLRARVW